MGICLFWHPAIWKSVVRMFDDTLNHLDTYQNVTERQTDRPIIIPSQYRASVFKCVIKYYINRSAFDKVIKNNLDRISVLVRNVESLLMNDSATSHGFCFGRK